MAASICLAGANPKSLFVLEFSHHSFVQLKRQRQLIYYSTYYLMTNDHWSIDRSIESSANLVLVTAMVLQPEPEGRINYCCASCNNKQIFVVVDVVCRACIRQSWQRSFVRSFVLLISCIIIINDSMIQRIGGESTSNYILECCCKPVWPTQTTRAQATFSSPIIAQSSR